MMSHSPVEQGKPPRVVPICGADASAWLTYALDGKVTCEGCIAAETLIRNAYVRGRAETEEAGGFPISFDEFRDRVLRRGMRL